jgi:hypothetical protein
MTRSDLANLQDRLTERDGELLRDVEKYRLLTTHGHLQSSGGIPRRSRVRSGWRAS